MNQITDLKVIRLRKRLSEGTYCVDPGLVADAILARPLGRELCVLQNVFEAGQRDGSVDEPGRGRSCGDATDPGDRRLPRRGC
jgi:hypothetical protein